MSLLLPFVIIGGYFCPRIGFTVVALITLFMILSSYRGRFYCGWLCPIDTYPGGYRKESGPGQVPSIECLRCSNCVTNCPKESLSFK